MATLVVGGLLTLGGVVLGALLNRWITLDLEERRERHERERDERIVRRAKRVVGDELRTLGGHLFLCAEAGTVPSQMLMKSERFLPLADWHRNRDLLAELLDDDEWESLSLPILFHNIERSGFDCCKTSLANPWIRATFGA